MYKLFLAILLISNAMNAQKPFEQDLISLAVLVNINSKYSGSGIFFSETEYVYFATAYHALCDENKNLIAKSIELTYYSIDLNPKLNETMTLDYDKLAKQKKIVVDSTKDICVIQIGNIINGKKLKYHDGVSKKTTTISMNIALNSMIIKYDEIEVGSNIYLIGYPKSLGLKAHPQYDFNLPLVRSGIVAGKFNERKTIIIDCPTYGGNSGGPVFVVEKVINQEPGKIIFQNKRYLIGIVTEFIPWVSKFDKSIHNSGFGVVISFEELMHLTAKL